MERTPDHVAKNRAAWAVHSVGFEEPGRKSWSTDKITWGNWSVPEDALEALGDLSWFQGKSVVELGCGTAYFSAWLARRGARPVGIDVTPEQLANARKFQREFGLEFPLIEGNAEQTPFPNETFDLALSEYGASIWCDPAVWIPEAARILRPGGVLVFLRNSPLSLMCTLGEGVADTGLHRPQFGTWRFEWQEDGSVEFNLPHGEMLRLLRRSGFEIEDLIEVQVPPDAPDNRFEYVPTEWAKQWPAEEIWRARKRA